MRAGRCSLRRGASRRRPDVELQSPAPGTPQRVRGALDVRWSASDPDGDPITTRIDLSTDDGRTWSPVVLDVTGERFRVPESLLRRTRRGRVRVVVEDGFFQAEAVSGRLRIDGIRPQVLIQSPAAGQRLTADARLNLVGQAFDDAGRELRGRRLRWVSRGRRLGRGAAISVLAAEVGPARHTGRDGPLRPSGGGRACACASQPRRADLHPPQRAGLAAARREAPCDHARLVPARDRHDQGERHTADTCCCRPGAEAHRRARPLTGHAQPAGHPAWSRADSQDDAAGGSELIG